MKKVSSYDAKTHLPSLLAEAEIGTRITITRHGVPVAILGPAVDDLPVDAREVVQKILALRRGRTLGRLSIRSLIEEGRR